MPSLPTPVYLLRFCFAFLLSCLTRSKSLNNSPNSFARFRTENHIIHSGHTSSAHRFSKERKRREKGEHTVDSLIFTILVNVVKVPQHFDQTQMTPRIVYDSFRSILDQVSVRRFLVQDQRVEREISEGDGNELEQD